MIRSFWLDLQYSVCNLNIVAAELCMEITGEEMKVMAFRGPEQIRGSICINE